MSPPETQARLLVAANFVLWMRAGFANGFRHPNRVERERPYQRQHGHARGFQICERLTGPDSIPFGDPQRPRNGGFSDAGPGQRNPGDRPGNECGSPHHQFVQKPHQGKIEVQELNRDDSICTPVVSEGTFVKQVLIFLFPPICTTTAVATSGLDHGH